MAPKAPGKVPAKPPSELEGGGGEYEAADYIASAVDDLLPIAQRHGFETLVYLLDMVRMEADEERRIWRVRTPPKGKGSSDQ
jgi:gamma-glutamyl:cysteine ligase YbdK (ATP-grasp superfamily)